MQTTSSSRKFDRSGNGVFRSKAQRRVHPRNHPSFLLLVFSSLYVMPKPALISLSEAKCDMSTFFLGNPLSAFGELRPFVVATLTIQPPICHVHFTKVAAVVAALEAVKAMKAATAAARAIADCYSGSSNSSQLQPQPDTHCHSTLSSSLLSSFT